MNLLILDESPTKCAAYHDDARLVTRIHRYASALLSAHLYLDGKAIAQRKIDTAPIVPEFRSDPTTLWVRESLRNYNWLHEVLTFMLVEFRLRYGHDSAMKDFVADLQRAPMNIPAIERTPWPKFYNPMHERGNVILSYRFACFSEYKDSKWSLPAVTPAWWLGLQRLEEAGINVKGALVS